MEDLSIVLNSYYQEIGVIPKGTREIDQVYARSAMMVALREYMTLIQIGRIFGKNHATIHHAVKNHENNFNWSKMYRFYFETAKDVLVNNPDIKIQNDNKLMAQFTRQKMRITELEFKSSQLQTENESLRKKIAILEADGNRN